MAELGQLIDDFDQSVRAFTTRLRQCDDGSTKVPHLEWTIGDTAAHVLSSHRLYNQMLEGGSPVWDDINNGVDSNERNLATITERDPAALADAIDETAAAVSAHARTLPAGKMLVPWGGVTVPIESTVCVWIGDVVVHGWDITEAMGGRWSIAPDVSGRALEGSMDIIDNFVEQDAAAGLRARFGLHIRGQFERTLAFDDGRLTVTDGIDGKVDCHISADPATFMLVGYGRIGQWGAILKGKLLAYGRKPWLGLRFATLLRNP